jgi:hypothetical protein
LLKAAGSSNDLINEIVVHWALRDCDGVIQLLEIYETESTVYLVLECAERGSLLTNVIKNQSASFTEMESRIIVE